MMKLSTSIALFSGLLGSILVALTPANALILVEPIVTEPDPNLPDGVGIPFNSQPNQLIPFSIPDSSGLQNFINDTDFALTRIGLFLFPAFDQVDDEDVIWGDVDGDGQIGFSTIFDNITVVNSATLPGFPGNTPFMQLSEGVIDKQERFVFQFITNPDLTPAEPGDNGPLVVGSVYDGVRVPEPSCLLGLGLMFSLGLNRRKKKEIDATT